MVAATQTCEKVTNKQKKKEYITQH